MSQPYEQKAWAINRVLRDYLGQIEMDVDTLKSRKEHISLIVDKYDAANTEKRVKLTLARIDELLREVTVLHERAHSATGL